MYGCRIQDKTIVSMVISAIQEDEAVKKQNADAPQKRTAEYFTTPSPYHLVIVFLREKLIKIGAKVISHGRYVTFQIAEVVVSRQMFADFLSQIARLRAPPAPPEGQTASNAARDDSGGVSVQLRQRGLALQPRNPRLSMPLARDESCCPLLKSFKRAILASNPPGISQRSTEMALISLYPRLEMARLSNVSPSRLRALHTRRRIRRAFSHAFRG